MTRSLLLDLCVEQDRILDVHFPGADAPPSAEFADEYVAALAAHVPLVRRAAQASRGGPTDDALVVEMLVHQCSALVERLRGRVADPGLRAKLGELATELGHVLPRAAGEFPTHAEAVEMVRTGQALELGEAFAGIAGLSTTEWAARVAAHRPPAAG